MEQREKLAEYYAPKDHSDSLRAMYYNLGVSTQLLRKIIKYIHERAYKLECISDYRAAQLTDLVEPIGRMNRSNVRLFIERYKKELLPLIEEIEKEIKRYERIEQQ